eukprot:m51a1_g1242 Endosomal Syntaxin D (493) ;mRNA; f:557550-570529
MTGSVRALSYVSPDAKASLDDVCANATLAECLVSATTRTCALRVLLSVTSSWTCTRYPQTAPPSDVRYDMGFAHVLLRLNATRTSTRAAALAALGRVAERCLPPPSLYAYSAPSLHLNLNSDFNYLHLRLAVHAGSNITSLADTPSEYADSLAISDEFLRCARGAAEPSFDISSVQGIASGRCGNGVVEDDEQCDGTPYCAPAACTCEWGTSRTHSGTCSANTYCTLVTGFRSPGDAAVDAPKFAAAFARCFDSEEVVVRAEPTRDRWAPQVRVVLAGADPAGLAANVASAEAKARGITAEIRRTAGASAGLAGDRKRERDALVGSFSRDLALLQDAASVALHAPAPPSARPAGSARGRRAGGAEEGEEGGGSDEGTALLLAARQRQLEDIDAEVAVGATDEQVAAIASGVAQINAMMLELASLVQEQGVVIDNIEVNVSSAARNVEDGNAELAEANRKQAKSRNTGCCLLATAAAILAVVVLVIVLPSVLA